MIAFENMKYTKPNLKKIQDQINAFISNFKNAGSAKEANLILKKYFKYRDKLVTNITIAEIRHSIDTTDKTYVKAQEVIDEIMPLISEVDNQFDIALVNSEFKNELQEIWGEHLFKMTEISLKCFDPKIIPELQQINKLSTEYSALIASAKIEYNGEVLNLSQLGKYTQDKNREVRKESSLLIDNFFFENNEKIGDIYDKLVKTRHQMALKLGYKNYVELGYYSLGRTDYNAEMVKGYRDQVYNDLVPYTNKIFKEQIKRIGVKKPQFYDYSLSFLSGNAKPHGDKDFMVGQAKKMYGELSKETSDFFQFLLDYHLMDLEAKPGKQGGGYMTYLPVYKAPFIFSNFNGTSGDVDVLTHEFGHAFQGYMSKNISCPAYRSPTLEACEIHSMSMEFITHPWMDLFFEDDADKYRYSHLADAIKFIPYGVTVDEFQHWVYENPEVTHAERCAKWKEIEAKYLPHRHYDETKILKEGGWWMRQSHIFGSPFYYIDYTLAQVVAFQFFVEDLKNHEKAWKKYVKLCKLGGKYPFVELLNKAKLNNPFNEGTIKKIIKPLKKYLSSFDTSKF